MRLYTRTLLIAIVALASPSALAGGNVASTGFRCEPGVTAPASFNVGACNNGVGPCVGVWCPSSGPYANTLVFRNASGADIPMTLPSLSGNASKVLSNDGTNLQWITSTGGGGGGGGDPQIKYITSAADLGAAINSADAALGAGYGVIQISDGNYNLATPVLLSPHRELRLPRGTITTTTTTYPFTVQSDDSIIGKGLGATVIKEPNTSVITTIVEYQGTLNNYNDGSSNIVLRDFKIEGHYATRFDSAASTIGIGNSHNVLIERIWLDHTSAIGINTGGGSNNGFHSTNVWIKDSFFTHVTSQNIGCVNVSGLHITTNTFRDGGITGSGTNAAYVDCEENLNTDLVEDFEINDNVFDGTNSAQNGNGILIQGSGLPNATWPVQIGPGVISGNSFQGTECDTCGSGFSIESAIQTLNAHGILISNNMIKRTAGGISLNATYQSSVLNNSFVDAGGGGVPALDVSSSFHNAISGNVYHVDLSSGAGSSDGVFRESSGSDYNWFTDNMTDTNAVPAAGDYFTIIGAHSMAHHNALSGMVSNQSATGEPVTTPVTASRSLVLSDGVVLVDTTAGSVTLTFPDASSGALNTPTGATGRRVTVMRIAGSNSVVLAAAGGQTIDGNPTKTITDNLAYQLQADGVTKWYSLMSGGGGGGGTIGGSIANQQICVGSGADTISGSAGLSYDGTNLTLGVGKAIKFGDGTTQTTAPTATIGGSIANQQVCIGSGTNTVSGGSGLTFDGTNLTLGPSQSIKFWDGTTQSTASSTDPNVVYVIQFPGSPNESTISHGFFWQPSQTFPDKMYWRMWLNDGGNGDYVISDGYGGSHALLLNAQGAGNIRLSDGSLLTFGADDTMPTGQWYEQAVEILEDYNGTIYFEVFFNGVCSGVTPLGVGLHRASPPGGNGGGTLYVGGSNHLNWNGEIAFLQGWDQNTPFGTITNYAPERFYSKNNNDTTGSMEPDFFADYTRPGRVINDLSWGYNGSTTAPTLTTRVKHPGTVFNYGASSLFNPYGLPQVPTSYPLAKWVASSGGPWTSDTAPTPPGGRSLTPPATPGGAKIFDSFSRQDQTYAFSNTLSLGSTESGSLGAKAWSMGVPSGFAAQVPSPYGIFNGLAVVFGQQPAVAWVSNDSADMTVSVDNRVGLHGQAGTGVAFRVQDKDNYWVCSLSSLAISSSYVLHLGYFSGGAYTAVNTVTGIPNAQYTVTAITSGTGVTCQIGDGSVYKMTTTSTQFQTATGAGIANQTVTSQANEGLMRWDNFTVF